MTTQSNKITTIAASIITAFNTQTNALARIRATFQKAVEEDIAANENCTFTGTLALVNEVMSQYLDNCESKSDVKLAKNYRATQLAKQFPAIKKLSTLLQDQVRNHLNSVSKLDNAKWVLTQIKSTTKTVKETNYPWTGAYKLTQKAIKTRTASTDTGKPIAELMPNKQPSNSTIANIVEGKSIKQQQALFSAIAKEGELKLSAQQVLDILFGLNAYTAIEATAKIAVNQ